MHQGRPLVAMVVLAASLAGCGRRQGPDVVYVEGIVLHEGRPIAGATVGFTPIEGGLPATGSTNQQGVFTLTSTRGGRLGGGVVAGAYIVTVSKKEYDFGGRPPPADDDYSNVPIRNRLPDGYASTESSDLRAVVDRTGGRTDKYRFELRSDFKPRTAKR